MIALHLLHGVSRTLSWDSLCHFTQTTPTTRPFAPTDRIPKLPSTQNFLNWVDVWRLWQTLRHFDDLQDNSHFLGILSNPPEIAQSTPFKADFLQTEISLWLFPISDVGAVVVNGQCLRKSGSCSPLLELLCAVFRLVLLMC